MKKPKRSEYGGRDRNTAAQMIPRNLKVSTEQLHFMGLQAFFVYLFVFFNKKEGIVLLWICEIHHMNN